MKAWGKGEDKGYGKDGGGGRVIMDEQCPSGSNGRGDDDS